jgi:hypothetical protein
MIFRLQIHCSGARSHNQRDLGALPGMLHHDETHLEFLENGENGFPKRSKIMGW